MKKKKFLLMGLLSLCLLFVGCGVVDDNSLENGGNLPPTSESIEDGGSSDGGSSNDNSSNDNSTEENGGTSSDNNQNENPYAGGLENGGEFEGTKTKGVIS